MIPGVPAAIDSRAKRFGNEAIEPEIRISVMVAFAKRNILRRTINDVETKPEIFRPELQRCSPACSRLQHVVVDVDAF